MINYGVVYPQAILVFVITVLYSVIQPVILLFGTVYFGIGYFVYKYKLLFGKNDLSTSYVYVSVVWLSYQYSTSLMNPKDKRGQ